MNIPGIQVEVSSLRASPPLAPSPVTAFIVGYAPWGPINTPVYVGDERAAANIFGAPAAAGSGMRLSRELRNYLNAAGGTGRAWAVRGFELDGNPASSYAAKIALTDSEPNTVITVHAAWPGALANAFKVDVITNPIGQKQIIMWGRYRAEVFTWTGSQAKDTAAIAAWNAKADAYGSDFRLELAGSYHAGGPSTTSSAAILFKASDSAISLTGGSNGDTNNFPLADLYGVDSDNMRRGLDTLADRRYGPGLLLIPGYATNSTLLNVADGHCRQYGRLFMHTVTNSDPLITATDVVGIADSVPLSSYLALYSHYAYDLDNVLVPSESIVAGLYSLNASQLNAEGGVKAAPVGAVPISGVVQINGIDAVGDVEAGLLFENLVNYIQFKRGAGYVVQSMRLSSPEGAISFLHHRVIANFLSYFLEDVVAPFANRTIDASGFLQDEIGAALRRALEPFGPGKAAPKGNTLYNPAIVVTDNSVQNESDLNNGELHVYVEASLSPKAERISLSFNIVPATIALG